MFECNVHNNNNIIIHHKNQRRAKRSKCSRAIQATVKKVITICWTLSIITPRQIYLQSISLHLQWTHFRFQTDLCGKFTSLFEKCNETSGKWNTVQQLNGKWNKTEEFSSKLEVEFIKMIIVRYSRSEYAIKVEHWALRAKFKVENECGKWKLVKKKSKMRICLHFTMCIPIKYMCMSYEAENIDQMHNYR